MKNLGIVFLIVANTVFAQGKVFKHNLKGITTVKIVGAPVKLIASNDNGLIMEEATLRKIKKDSVFIYHGSVILEKKNGKYVLKEKSKEGLMEIYPGGKDSTKGLGFKIREKDNVLIIENLKHAFKTTPIKVTLPKNINIIADGSSYHRISAKGFSSELELKTSSGQIDLEDVTGPITANSSYGKIEIKFSELSQKSPITINSSSSRIDITLPEDSKANIDVKGSFFTNFDVKLNGNNKDKITGTINGGGVKLKINTSYGEILLRKKK